MQKLKIIIIAVCVAAAAGAATFIVFQRLTKNNDPKAAVLSALAQTYGEMVQPDAKFLPLFAELINGNWRQDITVGVQKINGDFPGIEPAYLSAAEMLTIKNTTRRDTQTRKLTNTLALQIAATTLSELTAYADMDTMAFNLPQAFDYFVTVDPRRVTDEWDASLLGQYVMPIAGIILQEPFYDYYQRVLTATIPPPAETPAYIQHLALLVDTAVYENGGKLSIPGNSVDIECDTYIVTIPADALNAYWAEINPARLLVRDFPEDLFGAYMTDLTGAADSLRFEGDLSAQIYVYEGKVAAAQITARPVMQGRGLDKRAAGSLRGETAVLDDAEINVLLDDGNAPVTVRLALESRVGNPELFHSVATVDVFEAETDNRLGGFSWNIRWDKSIKTDENFSFALKADDAMTVAANGRLTADHVLKIIDADFKKLAVALPDGAGDISLTVKYLLSTDSEPVVYNNNNAMPLTRISELDVMGMYLKLMNDPQLGPLLSDVLGEMSLF